MQIFKYVWCIPYNERYNMDSLDESTFLKLLGGSPITKIIDFMLTSREFDYSKREIADNASISYNTLNSVWLKLVSNGIIIKTRRVGKQDMFRLNSGNALVKQLIKFFDALLKESIEEHTLQAKQLA